MPYTDALEAAISFFTLCLAAASTTLNVPSTSTSRARRGSSAHCVMRIAAWWNTMSLPATSSSTTARSRMSPSTSVVRAGRDGVVEIREATSDEVVQDVDVSGACVQQLIDEGGADRARAPRDEDVRAFDLSHVVLPFSRSTSTGYGAPAAARLPLVASRMESTRRPESPLVRGSATFANGCRELGGDVRERLPFGQRRRPRVAQPVGDVRCAGGCGVRALLGLSSRCRPRGRTR